MSSRVRPESRGHIAPLSNYMFTWIALLVLTVVTVGASYIDLGHTLNVVVALGIATVKASLVLTYFMHAFHDETASYSYGLIFPVFVLGMLILMTSLDIFLRIIPVLTVF